MKYANAKQLADWLMKNQPALFTALAKRAEGRAQLSGISDFFSSLGTGVANAASQVGSFIASDDGMKALTGLTTVYLATKQQKEALNAQIKLAQAGAPLAPIANTQDVYGGTVSYYYPPNGGPPIPMSAALAQQLAPRSSVGSFLPYLAIAGGIGLLFVIARN
jgi:hypothetical protein